MEDRKKEVYCEVLSGSYECFYNLHRMRDLLKRNEFIKKAFTDKEKKYLKKNLEKIAKETENLAFEISSL